ncbi:hypothetical protein C8J57DRAFT_1332729 [Mycena rebaudengoi]|nr:hypothetical protein C8J57DRAFT_1332729 [Mycena rebaudengoi]
MGFLAIISSPGISLELASPGILCSCAQVEAIPSAESGAVWSLCTPLELRLKHPTSSAASLPQHRPPCLGDGLTSLGAASTGIKGQYNLLSSLIEFPRFHKPTKPTNQHLSSPLKHFIDIMAPTSSPLQRRASVEMDNVHRMMLRRLSLERTEYAAAPNSSCDAPTVILAPPLTPLPTPPLMRRSLTKFNVWPVGAAHRRTILPLMERRVAAPAHQRAPAHHSTPAVHPMQRTTATPAVRRASLPAAAAIPRPLLHCQSVSALLRPVPCEMSRQMRRLSAPAL